MRQSRAELKSHWEYHISQWAKSGKTQIGYCKEHNLTLKSFGYWKRKLSTESDKPLVEIRRAEQINPTSSYIELITRDGMVLRFRENIPEHQFRNIITVLRG